MSNRLDSAIADIFNKIGTVDKFFVEFGTYDGLTDLSTDLYRTQGWSGLFLEADAHKCNMIAQNVRGYPVSVDQAFITAENINDLFAKNSVPKTFDFLNIDIDCMDYWIWSAVDYRPRVVFIEYNAVHQPPKLAVFPYNPRGMWNGTRHFGASLQSLVNLGKKKGYELAGCAPIGDSCYFVVEEEFHKLGIADNSAEKLYETPKYGREVDGGHPYPDGPYLAI